MAANPSAPLDVLLRLASLSRTAEHTAWKRRDIPVVLAEKLLATGNSTVALALDGPRSSPAVRRVVAEHPDAEVRDARRKFTEDSFLRGVWVSPDDLADYAGPGGLAGLASDPDPRLRTVVAKVWHTMPVATLRGLLADPDPDVRRAAASRYPHPPPEDLHEALLRDDATRKTAASYAVLTPEVAQEFLEGDVDLREAVARNPSLSPELRDRLAHDPDPFVRAMIVLRQDLSDDQRRRLYEDLLAKSTDDVDDAGIALTLINAAEWDMGLVGWLRALPLRERLRYLGSGVPVLRRVVASSRDLPPDVAARLDADDDKAVRWNVARRPDVPPAVLERLVTEHGERQKIAERLVDHPNFPQDGYVRLASNPDPMRRHRALSGKDLPVDVVVALAEDSEAFVRQKAATHPRLPADNAVALLADEDLDVVEAAGSAQALPVDVMNRLLDEAGL